MKVSKCQFLSERGNTCCILNFRAKRIKEFRTLETYRELSIE